MQIGFKKRIFLGFFVISLLIPTMGVFYWYFFNRLSTPIQKDIPSEINQVASQAKLDKLASLIVYYDETLTQSARNYAFTGDVKWKNRYNKDAISLDDAIKMALSVGDSQDKQYFNDINDSNIALVKMEEDSMALVDAGKRADAIKILESKEYAGQKDVYKKGIDGYAVRRGEQFNAVNSSTISYLKTIEKDTVNILNYVVWGIFLTTTLGFLVALILGIFISFSVQSDIEKYKIFYQSSKDALMTLEPPDWKFTSGNEATLKLFNVKNEKEFISLNPSDVSPEKQEDGQFSSVKAKNMIELALQRGSNFFEWTHKKYKGGPFPATVLLAKVEVGKKVFLQATVRDTTQEKEKQLEITRKTKELEDLNEHMVGRELKMVELKEKILKLEEKNKNENSK